MYDVNNYVQRLFFYEFLLQIVITNDECDVLIILYFIR
jgi:hypothetical protein